MSDIEPRYEFRVWGEGLAEFRERLERRVTPVEAASTETYLISLATDRCNAKIRAELIDIKVLLREEQGLEQWKPVFKAPFPLDQTVITDQIFPNLDIRPPRLSKAQYQMGEFLAGVIGTEPGIVIVELSKSRHQFNLINCQAEFTVVVFNCAVCETVAVESVDPDELSRLIREIGLDGRENLSYVRYIKRKLGLASKA